MKSFSLTMFPRLILPFFLLLLPAASAQSAQLQKIEHKNLGVGSEEVVISFDTAVNPKISKLNGDKPRIVFDFEGAEPKRGLKAPSPKSSLMKGLRMGTHNEKGTSTRLVFDLNALDGLQHSYRIDERNNRVIISLTGKGLAVADEVREAPVELPPEAAKPTKEEQAAEKVAQEESRKGKAETQAAARVAQEEKARANATTAVTEERETSKPHAVIVPLEAARKIRAKADTAPTPEELASEREEQKTQEEKTAQVGKEPPYLAAIQFDPDSPKGELVQFKLNGFYPPELRSIENPTPQVICEFARLKLAPALEGPMLINGGRLVKAIRLDKGEEKTRVFIELEPNKHYDLQQIFFKEDNFFVLMVNEFKGQPE